MKIQPISDMHLEFYGIDWLDPIEDLEVLAPILVIAGDFCTKKYFADAMRAICSKFKYVVFVPGNHEYYGSSFAEMHSLFEGIEAELSNLSILQERALTNEDIPELEDKKILGTTMWFEEDPDNVLYAGPLNDFRLIENFVPEVYANNRAAMAFLMAESDDKSLVVTHHVPSHSLLHARYKIDPLSRFFATTAARHMLEWHCMPALWIYGHTHMAHYNWDPYTRYVCNPMGYPGERVTGFDPKLVLEV